MQSYLQWIGWSGKIQIMKEEFLVPLIKKSKTTIKYSEWLSTHLKFVNKVKLCL